MKTFGLTFAALVLGCELCFAVQTILGWTSVAAASVLGLLVTFLPLPKVIDAKSFQSLFWMGCFMAMSSGQILISAGHVALIALVGALVATALRSRLHGLGGRMGMLAFVSMSVWVFIRWLAWPI